MESRDSVFGLRSEGGVSQELRRGTVDVMKRRSQLEINAPDPDDRRNLVLGRPPVFSKEAKARWARERSELIDISKYG